jgi:ankyrin repeat protein
MKKSLPGFILLACIISLHTVAEVAPTLKIIRDKSKVEQQKIEQLKELIKDPAVINKKSEDIPYITPLMLAADLGYQDIVKFLLENKADVNAVDSLNTPALFYAARKGHLEIVKLLLNYGAPVSVINKQVNNILLDVLRSYGANLADSKNKEQFKKNIITIIELLIDKGANVNAQGSTAEGGRSPILWAASWREYDLIKLLVRKKADLCAKDSFGNGITYYLPDPKKDNVDKTEANFIEFIKSAILQECDWTKI